MLSVVTCAQYGGWSDTGYCNKAYDAMYSQQAADADQAKRQAARLGDAGDALQASGPTSGSTTQDVDLRRTEQELDRASVASPQGTFNSLTKLELSRRCTSG